MGNSYWAAERWRILILLSVALLAGYLTGFWLISLVVALTGYISWLLYKVRQLHLWLENGSSSENLPEADGIWERITHQISGLQKKSNKRKQRMEKLFTRFEGIITGLPYATVVLNENNEIDWANRVSMEYLDIDISKDRGQRLENLIRDPLVHKELEKKKGKEIEVSLVHRSSKKLAIQFIHVQKNLKLLIARDISEREYIQKMRKNFIANASHELRTPLTVIAGYLEIMSEDEQLPESLKVAIASSIDQSNRMQRIIEDLLTLSRLENSDVSNEAITAIKIPLAIQTICKEAKSIVRNNSHQLETDIEDGLNLKGIEAEIISVISNLIFNAIRHTQEGTTVRVSWKKMSTGDACLTVADNGQGIPQEHIVHLTERFYRVDKGRSRDKGGTGLGLAIVQHVLNRHDGTLTIQSTLGKGSSFTVCFPKNKLAA